MYWIRRLLLAAAVLMVLYGVYFVYLAPYWAGQGFADAFRRLDMSGMNATLCDATTSDQIIAGVGSISGEIGRVLTGLLGEAVPPGVRDTFAASMTVAGSYDMLSSIYTFRLQLAGDVNLIGFNLGAGVASPEIAVSIRRGPLSACVTGISS